MLRTFLLRSAMGKALFFGLAAITASAAHGQPSGHGPLSPPANGPKRADSTWVALHDCTVHPDPTTQLLHATVVFRDGRITAILPGEPGPDGAVGTPDDVPGRVPLGPRVVPATDLHVYPGLIEPFAEVEAPAPQANSSGLHWSPKVTPQRNALDSGTVDSGLAGSLRKLGFTAAAVAPKGGIFRGTSEVVSLAKPSEEQSAEKPPVYASRVYQVLGFDTGGGYPSALMGSIALIRQTFFDADWQTGARERGEVVGALNAVDYLTKKDSTWFVADCTGELNALRAMKIAKEMGRRFVVLGGGREFARLEALQATGAEMILPLQFPKQPDVSSIGKIEGTELETLMAWEQAPTNPRRVAGAGIKFCLTTHRLRDKSDLWPNLRLAVAAGWTEAEALAALTIRPAELLGVDKWMGTIAVGKFANLVVADGPLLEKSTKIRSVWIDGREHVIFTPPVDLQGTWTMDVQGAPPAKRTLEITKENEITIHRDDKSVKATKVAVVGGTVSWVFDHEPLDGKKGQYASSAAILSDAAGRPLALRGQVVRPDGTRTVFSAQRQAPSEFEAFAGTWDIHMEGDRPRPFTVQVKKPDAGKEGEAWTVLVKTLNDDGTVKETPATGAQATRLGLSFEVPERGRAELRKIAREPSQWKGTIGGEEAVAAKRSGDGSSPTGAWRIIEADGKERLLSDPDALRLNISRDSVKLTFSNPPAADVVIPAEDVKIEKNVVTFTHPLEPIGGQGKSSDTITVEGNAFIGVSTLPDGSKHLYRGFRAPIDDSEDESQWRLAGVPEKLPVPFGPYGLLEKVTPASTLVITNVTIWTSGPQGNIENGTVIVSGDRIATVASGPLKIELPEGAVVIDGKGKHLTAGLIDAHSHTGISGGVNESAQAITSEVRIQDVTNPDTVDWYRQLAGGVTSVLSLHGSANAIGGQSQVTRIRWGAGNPDDMHDAGAIGGIKFALGENPTGKNRDGSAAQAEYPQTRMGVEMLIRDRFAAAKEYLAARARDVNTRRDLELEALGEVLEGKRLVHCHSYRQDEIVMLCMVARDFGFKIGTFQHILEGYKVAEYVRDYSGGGSGFADWWAYKVEVQDAIPQGLPLMHDVGAVVSFNSDSNEMARRMNVEAAKAVKYGRLSQIEALNFVTINPARQLRIDGWTGSIEVGKLADLALWSGSPLSSLSKCERTWVAGAELFSLENDAANRQRILAERHRIIQKILTGKSKKKESDEAAPAAGSGAPAPGEGRRRRRPTEDEALEAAGRALQREFLEGVKRRATQGECGCGLDHSRYEEEDRSWSHR